MNLKKFISSSGAVLLLAVYCLSIMPRTILHQVAANHTDVFVIQKDSKKETVSKSNFHCQLSDQVCTEPGLPSFIDLNFNFKNVYSEKSEVTIENQFTQPFYSYSLRGPPVFA